MKTDNISRFVGTTPISKRQWYVGDPIRNLDCLGICVQWKDGDEVGEETIAEVLPATPGVQEKQAALIVTAVNSHAALVAALEHALEWLEIAQGEEPEDYANPVLEEHIQQARTALAQAKGEQE
jgi:hypothetical protein